MKESGKERQTGDKPVFGRIIIVIIGVILVAVIAVIAWLIFKPNKDKNLSNEDYARELLSRALEDSGYYNGESDYELGLKVFDKAIDATKDEDRLSYIYIFQAHYMGSYYGKISEARTVLDSSSAKAKESSCEYQQVDYSLSILEGDWDRADKIGAGDCIND